MNNFITLQECFDAHGFYAAMREGNKAELMVSDVIAGAYLARANRLISEDVNRP